MTNLDGSPRGGRVHIEVDSTVRALLNTVASTVAEPQYEVASDLLGQALLDKCKELGIGQDAAREIASKGDAEAAAKWDARIASIQGDNDPTEDLS